LEKAFALKTATPELMGNGRIAIYPTLDRNVNMILILKEGFEWENRKKEEVWRCPRCRCYVYPTDKSKTRGSNKYHQICTFKKESKDEMDIQSVRVDGPPDLG